MEMRRQQIYIQACFIRGQVRMRVPLLPRSVLFAPCGEIYGAIYRHPTYRWFRMPRRWWTEWGILLRIWQRKRHFPNIRDRQIVAKLVNFHRIEVGLETLITPQIKVCSLGGVRDPPGPLCHAKRVALRRNRPLVGLCEPWYFYLPFVNCAATHLCSGGVLF